MGAGPSTSQAIGTVFIQCLGEAGLQYQRNFVENYSRVALHLCLSGYFSFR